MKKLILLLTMLCSISIYSQFMHHSVEGAVGANLHVSPLEDAQIREHFNLLYRYNISPRLGVGVLGSYDKLINNHETCIYDTKSWNITPEVYYRLLRRDRWAIIGHTGLGYSRLGEENLMNYVVGGTVYYKLLKRLSLKAGYMGTSYVYQKNALDNKTSITSNGVNSYSNEIFVGLAWRLGKGDTHADFYKSEPEIIRELEIRTEKETIIKQVVEREVEKVGASNEYIVFSEGSTKITKSQRATILRVYQFMVLNPEYKLAVVGYSCGQKGSFERNLYLSKERAKNVANQLISLGISSSRISNTGLGVDKLFKSEDMNYQKQAKLILYKVTD